ncbi:hypothetical protein GCM10009081_00210 [Brevundimonas nasdae]
MSALDQIGPRIQAGVNIRSHVREYLEPTTAFAARSDDLPTVAHVKRQLNQSVRPLMTAAFVNLGLYDAARSPV